MKKGYLNESGSSETIVTAIFLITAVVATVVMVNAIWPIITTTSGTVSATTHSADMIMRTDFKIVAAFNTTMGGYEIYMNNVGSQPISFEEINQSVVFCGTSVGNLLISGDGTKSGQWNAVILPDATSGFWDPGETLKVYAWRDDSKMGVPIYFQFVLPNGVWRSTEFT